MEILAVWLMVRALQCQRWTLLNITVENLLISLDVGGGATAEKVTEAFKIILSDRK